MKTTTPASFASEWIAAFNAHDLAQILSHYADDVELISPIYRDFTQGRTDQLQGKIELSRYFAAALERYPDLHFTLLDVAEGTRGLCLRYRTNLGDRIAMECIECDATGQARRVLCHYGENAGRGTNDG